MTVLQSSPATLFLMLWETARSWDGPQRTGARQPSERFLSRIDAALALDDGLEACQTLQTYLGEGVASDAAFRGQTLAIMRRIDLVFHLIHPRAVTAPASSGMRPRLPSWLRDARDERLLSGSYAATATHLLIPRGPLFRGPRRATASAADSLADRFASLGVAPVTVDQDGRQIRVQMRIIPPSASRGVRPGTLMGAEAVAFIPIAEAARDIAITPRTTPDQSWVAFRPSPDLKPTEKIIEALSAAGVVDLALAPEFMVDEADADLLAEAMRLAKPDTRLLIAGSGTTQEIRDGQPWNEARAVNAVGAELWRQRKLWPAGLDAARAAQLGIPAPLADGLVFEDTAAGCDLLVVDVEGLGRCVTLICQDLKAHLLADQVISQFQPDWVFVPLLDTGVGENRWMHRKAFSLSELGQSRFLVVTSTGLAEKAGFGPTNCAMAVGPQDPGDDEDQVACAVQFAKTSPATTGYAVIHWQGGRWLTTQLGTRRLH